MTEELFQWILWNIAQKDKYFTNLVDGLEWRGVGLQKTMATMRMLDSCASYGFHKYLHIVDSTATWAMKHFSLTKIICFEESYL